MPLVKLDSPHQVTIGEKYIVDVGDAGRYMMTAQVAGPFLDGGVDLIFANDLSRFTWDDAIEVFIYVSDEEYAKQKAREVLSDMDERLSKAKQGLFLIQLLVNLPDDPALSDKQLTKDEYRELDDYLQLVAQQSKELIEKMEE